jgi:fluoride exporter
MRYLQVLIGGAAGSLLRYIIGLFAMEHYGGKFPIGTFAINVIGSFLIGVVMTSLEAGWRPLLVTGVLGGFTTFSAFEWESFFLTQDGFPGLAIAYAVGSVASGFLACWGGAQLVHAARQ